MLLQLYKRYLRRYRRNVALVLRKAVSEPVRRTGHPAGIAELRWRLWPGLPEGCNQA